MNQGTKYNATCPIARKVRNFNLKLSNFWIRKYICFLHLYYLVLRPGIGCFRLNTDAII